MIQRTVAWILERCGENVTLVDGGDSQSGCAVIQPVTQKTSEQRAPSPLGLVEGAKYLYLGLPQYPVVPRRHLVIWRGHTYEVERGHPIYVGEDISHWWAVLVERDEVAL